MNKLFGYDTKGKVKEWSVTTEGAEVVVRHGLVGGKIQEKRTTSKAKNVGRANETTPEEQAIKDAQSKWNKQKDKNYHEDLSQAVPLENPMLAHDFRKQGHRIKYPASAQPKLDGVRCLIKKNEDGTLTFKSRGNKNYPLIQIIVDQVLPVFQLERLGPKTMLDGELYIHGESLQNIVSAVKKPNELTPKVQFHLFDVYDPDKADWGWEDRVNLLDEIATFFEDTHLVVVQDVIVDSKDCLKRFHDTFVTQGYEGIMVRNLKGLYKLNSRSPDLQKYKEFVDEEFNCVGVEVDKDGFGVLVLENHRWEEGKDERFKTFKAAWKGTHEERKAIADNPQEWINQAITVQYQALTDAGLPQFPVAVCIREVSDDGTPLE